MDLTAFVDEIYWFSRL